MHITVKVDRLSGILEALDKLTDDGLQRLLEAARVEQRRRREAHQA